MKNARFIDIVTLLETPTKENGFFYIVESEKGRHYVSALFGKEAFGMRTGTKLKLYHTESKSYGAYVLARA
jgi:isopenicillin N synthase-like dioxygenase